MARELTGRDLDTEVEREVFGDDLSVAANPERAVQACKGLVRWRQVGAYQVAFLSLPEGEWRRPDEWGYLSEGIGYEFWHHRPGREWQEPLERYVDAYRATPRSFSADLNLCFEVLVPDLKMFNLVRKPSGQWAVITTSTTGTQRGRTPNEAICRAAIAAAEVRG